MTAEKMELITTLIRAAMLIITIFVAPALRAWLKAHADEKTVKTMEQWADIAVRAAEQLRDAMDVKDPDGSQRKNWARKWIIETAKRMNVYITVDQADMLIEAAVIDNNAWWHDGVQKGKEV